MTTFLIAWVLGITSVTAVIMIALAIREMERMDE
jgi:hypothetical protein